ncbi:MAG TPA: hypothetical protein VFA93_00500 [Patescibacteria group bacterium]|nr:hypothetical protein [Patescibacteria group bacterium]
MSYLERDPVGNVFEFISECKGSDDRGEAMIANSFYELFQSGLYVNRIYRKENTEANGSYKRVRAGKIIRFGEGSYNAIYIYPNFTDLVELLKNDEPNSRVNRKLKQITRGAHIDYIDEREVGELLRKEGLSTVAAILLTSKNDLEGGRIQLFYPKFFVEEFGHDAAKVAATILYSAPKIDESHIAELKEDLTRRSRNG